MHKRHKIVLYTTCGLILFALSAWATRPEGTRLSPTVTADSLVVQKTSHILTLYAHGQALKSYRVALSRGGLEDKVREGDNRVPEGRFYIQNRLKHSAFHRALRLSYPDSAHTARAKALGVPPGHSIMIHGIQNGLGWIGKLHRTRDWTAGCIAVTNAEIEELWQAVPDGVPVVVRP
jgi:murein L,D-transpeptidase YafK